MGGAFITLLSIYKLDKDKCVRGVHPAPALFFATWGFWNFLIYYPSVNHWFSAIAAFFLTFTNIIWLCQFYFYRKN